MWMDEIAPVKVTIVVELEQPAEPLPAPGEPGEEQTS